MLTIGSCRVFRPMRKLASTGQVTLVNSAPDESWFTHTSASAVQFLEVMQGTSELPMHLREAVLESPFSEWSTDMRRSLPNADVAVVEVSSLKQYTVDGIHLNAHKVYGIASREGFDYQSILRGDTTALPSDHVLKRMSVQKSCLKDSVEDLRRIAELSGARVVAVDHLHALTDDGKPLAGRDDLSSQLRSAAIEAGATFHSTRTAIEHHGRDTALLDVNHYRAEFELVVGESLLRTIRCEV